LNGLASLLRRSAARQQQHGDAGESCDVHLSPPDASHRRRAATASTGVEPFAETQCRQVPICMKACAISLQWSGP
jgi:hypothetical protein